MKAASFAVGVWLTEYDGGHYLGGTLHSVAHCLKTLPPVTMNFTK